MVKIGFISLGCPRNLADSESILDILKTNNFKIVDDFEEADVAIVNTCGFIKDAVKESIDTILRLNELKKESKIKKLIVYGCLVNRYKKKLFNQLREADAFLEGYDPILLPELIKKIMLNKDRIKHSFKLL